jgi:hypothetical protein
MGDAGRWLVCSGRVHTAEADIYTHSMKHFKHPLCNTTLLPARGDEDVVDALHVQQGVMEGCSVTRSYWQPSPAELEVLKAGGCVVFTSLSLTHPPIRLDVTT